MSLTARARMRPVLYPAAILVAFVLNFLVDTGVSPYAAGRPLFVAVLVGLVLTWLAGLATGDRDLAGLVSGVLSLVLLAAQAPVVVVLGLVALALIVVQRVLARRREESRAAGARMWPVVTRLLTAGAAILLVAVGVKAIQLDRVATIAHDLAAEFPFRPGAAVAAPPAATALPNMYFILLDGYPRADKLVEEFGIDNSGFIRSLGDRGFAVASHSRSNYTITYLTLAQMFSYSAGVGAAGGPNGTQRVLWRHLINEGRFFTDIRELGYRVTGVSPAFEHVALRQADRFVDTGQLNEFEWNLIEMTGLRMLVDTVTPGLTADLHRDRVLDAFRVLELTATNPPAGPQFVFMHVISPHSPQVFERDGAPIRVDGFSLPYSDRKEIADFGWTEYTRRLEVQLEFLNGRTLDAVDVILASDPRAVVVVFSDHGSGLRWDEADIRNADPDLRTANLLAVRTPGQRGIVDDRSTLANLLPRLLRAYAGVGPADVPEAIYVWADQPEASSVYARPD